MLDIRRPLFTTTALALMAAGVTSSFAQAPAPPAPPAATRAAQTPETLYGLWAEDEFWCRQLISNQEFIGWAFLPGYALALVGEYWPRWQTQVGRWQTQIARMEYQGRPDGVAMRPAGQGAWQIIQVDGDVARNVDRLDPQGRSIATDHERSTPKVLHRCAVSVSSTGPGTPAAQAQGNLYGLWVEDQRSCDGIDRGELRGNFLMPGFFVEYDSRNTRTARVNPTGYVARADGSIGVFGFGSSFFGMREANWRGEGNTIFVEFTNGTTTFVRVDGDTLRLIDQVDQNNRTVSERRRTRPRGAVMHRCQ